MSKYFKNKYRIETSRLKDWDYSWNAYYFVTICTLHRACFFGEVLNGKMVLNDIGSIAHNCWLQIPNHFPFVKLDSHVVMPNHVHGIIIIDKPVETQNIASLQPTQNTNNVQTQNIASKPSKNKFGPQSKNLASIIRGFKIGVTKNARLINHEFEWQKRFHDHIIRNEKSLHQIQNYIINNPMNWSNDQFR